MPPKKRAKKPKEVPIPLEVQLEQAIQEREKAKGALTEKDLMMDPKLRKLAEAIGLKKKYRDIPVDVEMDTSQVFTRIKVLGKNQFKKVYLVQGQTDGRYYIFVKDRPLAGGNGPPPPPPEVEQVSPDVEGLDPEDRQDQQKAEGEGGEGEGGEGDDSEGDGGGEGGESGEGEGSEGEGSGEGEDGGEGEGGEAGEGGEGEGGEGQGGGEGEDSDEGEGSGGKGGEDGEGGEGQGGGEGDDDSEGEGEGGKGGGRPPQQWIGPFTGPDAEEKLFKEMAKRAELLKAKRRKGAK